VEGKIIYGSKERTVLDRAVENLDTPNLFLTANLGIKKTVFRKCKFDERFIVFREDTDFGLSALEHGFKSTFNTNAKVFHKKSKFSIKRFIFERERYIGEPLLLKKHLNNELVNNYIKRIGRILYPEELVFMILMVSFLFYNPLISLVFYFFPGGFYLFKKYKTKKYIFNARDSAVVLLLLPVTMFVKRLAMWKGAIRFKIFCV
jgi:GT2 family glycosyltransferase